MQATTNRDKKGRFIKGFRHTSTSKRKISIKMKLKQIGVNNSNWKGGKSANKKYLKKYKIDWYKKHYIYKGYKNCWTEKRRLATKAYCFRRGYIIHVYLL